MYDISSLRVKCARFWLRRSASPIQMLSKKNKILSPLVTEIQLHNLLSLPLPTLYIQLASYSISSGNFSVSKWKCKWKYKWRLTQCEHSEIKTKLSWLISVSNGLKTENWNQKLNTASGRRNTECGKAYCLTNMTTQIRQHTAYVTKHSPNTVIVFAADTLRFRHWWQNYWCHLSYRWMEAWILYRFKSYKSYRSHRNNRQYATV